MLFETFLPFQPITGVGYLKLSDDLKWDVLFETFQTFQPITGVGYLKLSDKTWSEMCYLKLFNLFKPIMRAAYLKLSGETWKRGAIWNFWNLKLFKPIMGGLLIWKFQMRLEKEVLFEMFETWNFSNMSWGVLYLKLSDETWSEMCYLKLFYLFKPITRVAYFKLSDDLKQDMLFEMFETWNFSNMSWGLLIWNFQMRLEMRCAIWNFSKFSTHHRSWLFETFR